MKLPVIFAPGPDCAHPLRLCMVTDLSVCEHALGPVMGRNGYHVTRCGRDLTPMTEASIAVVLGESRDDVHYTLRQAAAKLKRNAMARQLVEEQES